jgi:hypothetical protein
MNRTAAGVFDTYAAAGKVVQELELLGISGEQVEVVSDAAHDVRGEGVVPELKPEGPESSETDYTLVIVRPSDDVGMEQAKNLMDRYGAKLFRWQISVDEAPLKRGAAETTRESSIGGPGTTGVDSRDLEGRGRQISVHDSDPRKSDRELSN